MGKSKYEVEQKYRVPGPEPFRKALRKLGARKLYAGNEQNELYDRDNHLRKSRSVLRLRHTEGLGGRLTFKGPRMAGRFKKRLEVESAADFKAMKIILKRIGYSRVAVYRKWREEYRLGPAYVAIDRLPRHGWFLEIEAPSSKIPRYEKKLGLAASQREDRTYLQIKGLKGFS